MFQAYLCQEGGCDYTIGCGNLLIQLSGETLPQAIEDLKEKIKENYTGDRRLSSVTIIKGESVNVDVDSIYEKIESDKRKQTEAETEASERQQYERLKKKFGW
jgi:hypothetical protein